LLDLPAPDPDGLDPLPLEQALARLEAAQLVEHNLDRRQLRLHPLIHDFVRQRAETGCAGRVLDGLASELDRARAILALRADRLSEIARALASLSSRDSRTAATGALPDLCRMLRVEAHALSQPPTRSLGCPIRPSSLTPLHCTAARV
jgi:hypothetical protein